MSARESMHLTDAQVDDYADAAMGDAERAMAEAHLASCERCRRAVDETRAVLAWTTRERAAVTAPAELWPLVAASTIHLAATRRAVIRSMRGVLVIGAIALVAATATITWTLARWTAEREAPPSAKTSRSRGAITPVRPLEAPSPSKAPVAPRPPEPR